MPKSPKNFHTGKKMMRNPATEMIYGTEALDRAGVRQGEEFVLTEHPSQHLDEPLIHAVKPTLKYYRGQSGKIHAQANLNDSKYGLRFATVEEMREAFTSDTELMEVPRSTALEEKYQDVNQRRLALAAQKRMEHDSPVLEMHGARSSVAVKDGDRWTIRFPDGAMQTYNMKSLYAGGNEGAKVYDAENAATGQKVWITIDRNNEIEAIVRQANQ